MNDLVIEALKRYLVRDKGHDVINVCIEVDPGCGCGSSDTSYELWWSHTLDDNHRVDYIEVNELGDLLNIVADYSK